MIPFFTISNSQTIITKSDSIVDQIDNLISDLIFTPNSDPFFSLVFKTVNSEPFSEYANFSKQQLAEIGINITIELQDWPLFLDTLLATHNFDFTTIQFVGGSQRDDPNELLQRAYTEGGTLNIWGYDQLMDWDDTLGAGLNEWFIQNGSLMMPPNSQERIDHYKDWQQHLMNDLLLLIPLFTEKSFSANWANLNGFNYSKGNVLHNWGHLSWDGIHPGQISTSEIVIADDNWTKLNPLNSSDEHSDFIMDACLDKLIYMDEDCSFWPHLAESWNFINDTTLEITLRDDIQWMDYGGFTNEYLNVKDLYFTLYCLQHELSIHNETYVWIKGMEIIDDMTLKVFIDGNPLTSENDPYLYCLDDLSTYIVPEHFLNQTQEVDGITPDVTHPSWTDYSTNCWGTGLFEIDTFTEAIETILTIKPDCWMLDPLVDKSNMDFVNRFGDFIGGLTELRVRIMDNQTLITSEFEAGKLDIIDIADIDKRFQYSTNSSLAVHSKFHDHFSYFGFNVREGRGTPMQSRDPCPFLPTMTKGLAIRKAMAYAINRVEIDNEVHNDSHYIVDYPTFSTLGVWCNEDIIKYDYNLYKAKEYMLFAGYDLGLDSDSDGLSDFIELNTTYTDRLSSDTDSDLMPDGWEVDNGLNPLVDDSADDADLDRLTNGLEYQYNTNPNEIDTDMDGYSDYIEITSGSDPTDPNDYPQVTTLPPETVTPPPETITQNTTFTITVETGLIFSSAIITISLSITFVVVLLRKRRKKNLYKEGIK
jgi:ABC-type transport system substrate-binding protein